MCVANALKVATGLAKGPRASAELITQAIGIAMHKAGISSASQVLLFLTSEFAAEPQLAIKAAAKAASSTQVMGCSASGIYTEDDWVLDGAAAAVMVFSEQVFSTRSQNVEDSKYLLTLAAPNAINSQWLHSTAMRFGAVSGDATGRGPFSVWQNGKGITQGYCELATQYGQLAIAPSHGIKFLSSPRKVTVSLNNELISVANIAALTSLQSAYKSQNGLAEHSADLPYHLLMVAYAKTASALSQGDYQLATVVIDHETTHTLSLSQLIPQGYWLRWAIRDIDSAQDDIANTAQQLSQQLSNAPEFALFFSCMGRGPYFYNGEDADLAQLTKRFPRLPIIGFYGNGQIAPTLGENTLLQYSAVLALFSSQEL